MIDALRKFIDHMKSVDCEPFDSGVVVSDDTRHYYRLASDKATIKKGSYILRVDPDGFAVGGCMNMRDGIWHSWHSKSARGISEEDKAAWTAKRDAARAEREREEHAARDRAAGVAVSMWDDATSDGVVSFPYVVRKGMTGEGLRVWTDLDTFTDWLLVPVYSASGSLVGMQKISAEGDKLFIPGSAVSGGRMWLGDPTGVSVVALVEGVATGDAVRRATGWPVCVAFNAGNLKAVAVSLGATGRVVVCADDDRWTWASGYRDKRPDVLPNRDAPEWDEWRANGWLENPGRIKAEQAAVAAGGLQVLIPPDGCDWDDCGRENGLEVVWGCFIKPV